MKYVQDQAYNNSALEPNEQRILKLAYHNLNDQAVSDLTNAGQGQLASDLMKAKNTYKNAFLLESQMGRYGTLGAAAKASGTVQNLYKATLDPKLGAKIQERVLDPLKNISPELHDQVSGELTQLSEQYAKAGKKLSEKEIKQLVSDRINTLAETDPEVAKMVQMANAPKEQFSQEAVNDAIPKDLAEKQQAFTDSNAVIGKQKPLESIGEVQPSSKIFNVFRKDNVGKDAVSSENYQKLLPKMVGEEKARDLIKTGKAANNLSDLVTKISDTSGSFSPHLTTQVISRAPSISVAAGNIIGLGERAAGNMNLAKALNAATPDKIKQLGTLILNSGGDDVAKTFAQTLNTVAESTDPIKRRAVLFTLQQNPEFRKIFGDGNEQQ